jgi:serine/threonine-protein kinase
MAELPLVGEEFAGYRLVSVLGRGGMSIVFRAENPRLGNVIALKVLDPALASDDIFRTRFLEESRIAASMNHPNVIPIHDTGSSDGLLYIAMRCVTGTDLRQMLRKRGRLQPETAVFLLEQAARALDAAHRRGLVHRDVKPGNLLVERGNDGADPDHVYLADFGITKHLGGRTGLTSTGAFLGTIDYVAPEQIRGISVLGLADQYSLGCVLYECLTGRVPFEKDLDAAIIWAHVEESPTQPTLLRPDLPPALDEVFARVLAKNPGDRFETCREFMAAARAALGHLAEPPSSSGSLPMRPPMSRSAPYPAEPGAYVGAQYSPEPGSYQGVQYGSQPDPYPWTELAHESADAYQADAYQADAYEADAYRADAYEAGAHEADVYQDPATNWSSIAATPPLPSAGQPVPPHPPGGKRRSRRRGRGWLVAAALVLVAGGAAAGTAIALTDGHNSPVAEGAKTPAAARAGSTAPSVAVPTVAGKVQVGQNPSYIQVAPNGKFAYIANPGAGAITVLNTATDLVSGTIKIPQGPPQFVSFSPDSRTAYVSVYTTRGSVHLIAFIDTAAGTVTSTVSADNFTPGPTTTSPDGRYLYVPNHNMVTSGANENVVDVIDIAGKKLIGKIAVPANPHWVAFDKNGRFYTSDHMSAEVTVLNAKTNGVIGEIETGETPHSEAISPDGSRLAVTSFNGNEVFLINTATEKMIAQIPVGRNPLDIAYSPDGRYIFTANNEDSTVTVIDTADNRVIGEVPTGKAPTSISVLPNGRQAYVTDDGDGSIEILNLAKAGVTPASAGLSSPAPGMSSSPAASASMSGMPGM